MNKLEKYNCIVTIYNGELQMCKIVDGTPEFSAGSLNWQPVREPVTQDFLDAVNEALNVHLTVESFSLEKQRRT